METEIPKEQTNSKYSFIQELEEARMTRDGANRLNLTYNDCKDRIMLLFLVLQVMRYYRSADQLASSYAQKTVRGDFQTFRIGNTDLHNFLYFVTGPDEAQEKLKNPIEAKKFRQFTKLPMSMIKRHLFDIAKNRTPTLGESNPLQRIESSLRIVNSEYKSLRRNIENFMRISPKDRANTATRLVFAVRAKLPDSDITKQFQDLVSKANLENPTLTSPEPDISDSNKLAVDNERRFYRMLLPVNKIPLAKKFLDYAEEGKSIPSVLIASYLPIVTMVDNIVRAGPGFVEQLRQLNNRAKNARK